MKKFLVIFGVMLLPFGGMANGANTFFVPTMETPASESPNTVANTSANESETPTTVNVLSAIHDDPQTDCASTIFLQALYDNEDEVSVEMPEYVVRAWAKNTMLSEPVLTQVLNCPEIASASDETIINFTPIVYEFPNKVRNITINYSTTPKVLKQHLLLATKPSLPTDEISPKLMDPDNPAKYLNTEPAWYGILVVEHDSLSEFVGPDKNNTVSMKYIDDNIDNIYPHGSSCTSKSAITLGNDYDTINKVVREVVDLEDDSNDYYVMGDVNLEWVMYAEIAADVIITVATWGGGAVAQGVLKGIRTGKNARALKHAIRASTELPDVKNYMSMTRQIWQHSDDIAKLEKNIEYAQKYQEVTKEMNALKKAKPGSKGAKQFRKDQEYLDKLYEMARKNDPSMTRDMLKDPSASKIRNKQNALRTEMEKLGKDIKDLEETSEDVQKYGKQLQTLEDLMKYRRQLTAIRRRQQTGNVITRLLRTFRGINTGAKEMSRAARAARAGMSTRSAKISNWLFDATLKHGARLAKFESKVGFWYGAASFLGDMYDQTSATSKEFSNGIEFKPLCLLAADNLESQENVVNYGMWLMWVGNSTDPADDDAAYLQAMDFAAKFYYQLDEYQDEHGKECNVDIYVVRPIIRLDETNVDDPHGQMFWLFMNEIPWTTAN